VWRPAKPVSHGKRKRCTAGRVRVDRTDAMSWEEVMVSDRTDSSSTLRNRLPDSSAAVRFCRMPALPLLSSIIMEGSRLVVLSCLLHARPERGVQTAHAGRNRCVPICVPISAHGPSWSVVHIIKSRTQSRVLPERSKNGDMVPRKCQIRLPG
jgi:hypothetical protein